MPDADQPGTAAPAGSPAGAGAPSVTVRYWAAAREAAGVDSDAVVLADDGVVSAVLAVVRQRHPALEPVLAVSSILLDGRVVAPTEPVPAHATLEVLPPFAGG